MASEPEPSVQLINVFYVIIFGSLIGVVAIVLLAVWLKSLEFGPWLSEKVQEYRARRGIDDAHAQSGEHGMVESHDGENRAIDNGVTE